MQSRKEVQVERLSVPGPARTLSAATEQRAFHVRRAVKLMESGFLEDSTSSNFSRLFHPFWPSCPSFGTNETIAKHCAWALANIWMLSCSVENGHQRMQLLESEEWFLGEHRASLPLLSKSLSERIAGEAVEILSAIEYDRGFRDLLPYILEPHGPGSRASVIKDPSTQAARQAKRQGGVFYTPADVAEYMAETVLREHGGPAENLRCLDPCCGTGVFLVALLHQVEKIYGGRLNRFNYIIEHLYGIDISGVAVESCVFVLLHECLSEIVARGMSPWAAWHAIRLNFTVADSLLVYRPTGTRSPALAKQLQEREDARRIVLGNGCGLSRARHASKKVVPRKESQGWTGIDGELSLDDIFPEASEGFDVLIGNPPYTTLSSSRNTSFLCREFACLSEARSLTGHEDIFPLFVELMWRLTRCGNSSTGLVVPLSIAYQKSRQYALCREAMAANGGRWRTAFFDREPHALFGEDVKTRNAIIFRRETSLDPKRGFCSVLETTALHKWTSRTRQRLFCDLEFTNIGSVDLSPGFPKLAGRQQTEAFKMVLRRNDLVKTFWERARKCQPVEACKSAAYPRVFVGSTAYNFLNVFRWLTPDSKSTYPLSENGILCFEFAKEETAEIVFAILSSRLTYWLWQVYCDGFHVPRWFIEAIPFGRTSFTGGQAVLLSKFGRELWREIQQHRIISINGGKQSIAYKPLACEEWRNEIDAILIEAGGLSKEFALELRRFVRQKVVVDEEDDRRDHLRANFETLEV